MPSAALASGLASGLAVQECTAQSMEVTSHATIRTPPLTAAYFRALRRPSASSERAATITAELKLGPHRHRRG